MCLVTVFLNTCAQYSTDLVFQEKALHFELNYYQFCSLYLPNIIPSLTHLHRCHFKVGLLGHDVAHVGVFGQRHDLCDRILGNGTRRVGGDLLDNTQCFSCKECDLKHSIFLKILSQQFQNAEYPESFDAGCLELSCGRVVKAGRAVEN